MLKTQGRHGEVAVDVHSDVPDRFQEGVKLFALGEDNQRRELEIETLWPHKGLLVLKFAGVDSISAAEPLIDSELQVSGRQRGELEAGWNYVSDLVGCEVFDQDCEIGQVEDVRLDAGEAPLLILRAGQREIEIPFAEAYLQEVDLSGKKIRMRLPEGMLDLDAPLSAEEKEQQKRSSQ